MGKMTAEIGDKAFAYGVGLGGIIIGLVAITAWYIGH